jgi:energy-coupling factor transport system substrate-specific component
MGREQRSVISGQLLAKARGAFSALTLLLASLLGVWAFIYPFFFPPERGNFMAQAHGEDAPLLFVLLTALCITVVVANLETQRMNAKIVATLGVLSAINAVLRLVPGPAGFSAAFFLPILCGYAYGADFGFLLGVISLLVSAVITSGIGPWLPFQMVAAGWMGLLSGWLPDLSRRPRLELVLLALWGGLLGFLFGVVMNLWFWPYLFQPGQSDMYWQPGASLVEAVGRYALFYLATSLWWDMGRAGGNFLLLLLTGGPVLRLLRRFRRRFYFEAA